MTKILAVILLFILVFRFIGAVMRRLSGTTQSQRRRNFNRAFYAQSNARSGQQKTNRTKPSDGNVYVDHVPQKKKDKPDKGEYIDFEEVD